MCMSVIVLVGKVRWLVRHWTDWMRSKRESVIRHVPIGRPELNGVLYEVSLKIRVGDTES